jgi:RNA polymerase sigma factor (sigma-70 family)
MPTQVNEVLRHLRGAFLRQDEAGLTDGQLLGRFIDQGDHAAVRALVRRHGPMVWGVCRRVVGNHHDPEDAFQATFLVMVRKAASVRRREIVGHWLYGVAYKTAMKARATRAKRRSRERQSTAMPEPQAPEQGTWNLMQPLLDQELSRLPEKYRVAIVLCDLEGKTRKEAARQLGLPEGTLAGRLTRGRAMLAKRLTRRGLALSGGALAILVTEKAAAAVPTSVLSSTLKAVTALAAGQAGATLLVSARVAVLTEGVVKGMLLNKLLKVTAVLLVLAVLTAGAVLAGCVLSGGKPPVQTKRLELKPTAPKGDRVQPQRDRMAREDEYGDPLPEGAIARLGTVRFRHDDWVSDVALSPDDATLAAAGQAVSLWDPATGKRQRRLTSPGCFPRCLAYSPDGKTLAVGGSDNQIHLWNLTSGQVLRRLQGHQPSNAWNGIHRVVFCKGGKQLISSGADGTVRLWEVDTGKEVRQFQGHHGIVSALALSEDGRTLAGAPSRGDGRDEVLVWEVASGKRLWRLPHPHLVCGVAFSRDGKTLATGSGEVWKPGEIRLFRVPTGKLIRSWRGHQHWVLTVAFAPDGRTLATGGYEGTVRRWQVSSGRELGKPLPHRWQVKTICYSRDGKSLVTRGAGNTLYVWDVAAGKERQVFAGHQNWIASLAFSPDGRQLAAGSGGFAFRLWDVARCQDLYRSARDTGNIVAFGPGGKSVVASSYLGTVYTLRAHNPRALGRAKIKGVQVSSLAYSADGRTLAFGGVDRRVRIWDLVREKEIRSWQTTHRLIDRLALSQDCKTLASAGMDGFVVQLWDVGTGKEARRLNHAGAVECLAFSPDGKTLVAGVIQDRSLHLWETATGRERRAIRVEDFVTSVGFSPDGKWLATASNGSFVSVSADGRPLEDSDKGKVTLWSLATGKKIHRFASPQGGVRAIAFSPDGKKLASGGNDTTILLWDLTRLRLRQPAPPALSARAKDALWADLAGTDAARAYRAIWILARAPKQAVALLGKRLRPVTAADPKRVGLLLGDLDSGRFPVRKQAERDLEKLGDSAEPALRDTLARTPSVEVRQRIEQVLRKLKTRRLRYLRALEVLEILGAADADPLLKKLAEGAKGAGLTAEAKTSLQRLARNTNRECRR